MPSAPKEPDTLPQPNPANEALTLEQWAASRSSIDRQVELLNGFVAVQRAEGRFTATEAEWMAAYAAFAARPV